MPNTMGIKVNRFAEIFKLSRRKHNKTVQIGGGMLIHVTKCFHSFVDEAGQGIGHGGGARRQGCQCLKRRERDQNKDPTTVIVGCTRSVFYNYVLPFIEGMACEVCFL